MNTSVAQRSLPPEAELCFHDELRKARSIALADAEGFHDIILCLERLGYALEEKHDGHDGLYKYRSAILKIAERSPLAQTIPDQWKEWHLCVSDLYESVRNGRNDAFHLV